MSKVKPQYMDLDPATLEDDGAGNLRQVPGTDGGGGGGGGGTPVYERIAVVTNFADGYVDLSYVPLTPRNHLILFVEKPSIPGEVSPRQFPDSDFTIVRSTVGGDFDRIVWDSSATPSGGNGTTIPDADAAPTEGMEDIMQSTFYLVVNYFR